MAVSSLLPYPVVVVTWLMLWPPVAMETTVSGWNVLQFPNPREDIERCGRGKVSWVCDPTGILSQDDADEIDMLIEEIREIPDRCICDGDTTTSSRNDWELKCPNIFQKSHEGIQPAVALVDRMYMSSSNPTDDMKREAATEFAEYLREEKWAYGLCDDDYVIFVSLKDGQVFTAAGKEANWFITDKCINQIFDKFKTYYANGDYAGGIKGTLSEYAEAARGRHECRKDSMGMTVLKVIAVVVCVLIFLAFAAFIVKKIRSEIKSEEKDKADKDTHYSPAHQHDDDHHGDDFEKDDTGGTGGDLEKAEPFVGGTSGSENCDRGDDYKIGFEKYDEGGGGDGVKFEKEKI